MKVFIAIEVSWSDDFLVDGKFATDTYRVELNTDYSQSQSFVEYVLNGFKFPNEQLQKSFTAWKEHAIKQFAADLPDLETEYLSTYEGEDGSLIIDLMYRPEEVVIGTVKDLLPLKNVLMVYEKGRSVIFQEEFDSDENTLTNFEKSLRTGYTEMCFLSDTKFQEVSYKKIQADIIDLIATGDKYYEIQVPAALNGKEFLIILAGEVSRFKIIH